MIAKFYYNTTQDGAELLVSTALSAVSMDGAEQNLKAEVPDDDFDKYLVQAKTTWNKELSKIEIETHDTDEKTVFYTALYHSMIASYHL